MSFDYDLFVIGGGSGGVRAARMAAETGARVGLAEESRMGGTCVIRGCVPKKLMVYASGYPDQVAAAQAYGWDATLGDFDWTRFRGKLHAELDRLEAVYRKLLHGSKVEIHDARAVLEDPHTVRIGDDKTVTAKHILIATGGHPVRPDVTGAKWGLVSNDMFLLDRLPETLLIVGGGYIACEFACIMAGLGVKVTMYVRGAQILKGFDDEARGLLAEAMRHRGIDIHTGTSLTEMTREGDRPGGPVPSGSDAASGGVATMGLPAGERPVADDERPDAADASRRAGPIWTRATNGTSAVFDHVLFATGRAPNTDNLGLDDAGVTLGRHHEIVVDDYSQTNVPSVYAIGDVTDRVQLTPVAIREGMAFVETVFKGKPTAVDHELIASAVFTQPELGSIGETEEQVAARGEAAEIYATTFRPMQTAFIDGPGRVMMKLVVSAETRKVLGCHIVADHAGEMIQMAAIAIRMGATKEDFDRTCAVHPTMAEEMVTMRHPVRKT
ncbi:NADPH-glutathione reductase [Loktanella fryxellensis]|uniref:NADPH-glutathione reductase n=1 Tax=Loktanella fryxellensis TaxID=245187 RepID=A0A1H8EM46_9RHOB|nr:FAD-dependent oxidoreductase [Loktanella fryxellensis]SEN20522.1 NADPH-glutathione reductase [Loktanella fryxellensis]